MHWHQGGIRIDWLQLVRSVGIWFGQSISDVFEAQMCFGLVVGKFQLPFNLLSDQPRWVYAAAPAKQTREILGQ